MEICTVAALHLFFILVLKNSKGLVFIAFCDETLQFDFGTSIYLHCFQSKSCFLSFQGLIYRFKILMLATLLCAALTVIFFIISQVSESTWKWGDENSLEYTSAFLTGVYGMWNLYVFALLSLYAPSHKMMSSDITGMALFLQAICLCFSTVVLCFETDTVETPFAHPSVRKSPLYLVNILIGDCRTDRSFTMILHSLKSVNSTKKLSHFADK
jgi:hypothetical protein